MTTVGVGGGGSVGNGSECVAASEVAAKGGVVVTGAETKLGRQRRQRFNLLRAGLSCYIAN